jgi:hypothetical protein
VNTHAAHTPPDRNDRDASWSAAAAGDERGDDVRGVPIQGLAATVIPHRRSRVGVTGGFLHVTQRHTGVQGGGDEAVAQGVRTDPLRDPGAATNAAHDPSSGVTV